MQILSTQFQTGAQAHVGLQGVECGGEVAWEPVEVFTSHLFPEAPTSGWCPSLPPACGRLQLLQMLTAPWR